MLVRMSSDIDNAVFEAWANVYPKLLADPAEVARRVMRRRQPLLTRPPRAYCIAIRASDNRINAWDFACVPEKAAMLTYGKFLRPWPHEVTLNKPGLVKVTAPVDLTFWRAHDLNQAATKLGVQPDTLHYQRKKGFLKVDYVKHLFGRKGKNVPLIMRDGLADPCGRNGHTPAAPEWQMSWADLAQRLPEDFCQTLDRVPSTRVFRDRTCFRGWRWICPMCERPVASLFLPMRHMSIAEYFGVEETLGITGGDAVRTGERTFACVKCHRVRYFTSLDHDAWNQLVAFISGGLLYGTEAKRPDWFTPRRRRIYKRHKSRMVRGKEVERLLIKGLTYRQVADEMGIKLATVQGHVLRLYKKRGVHSRKALRDLANAT